MSPSRSRGSIPVTRPHPTVTGSRTAATPWVRVRRHARRSSTHSSVGAAPAIPADTAPRACGTPSDRTAGPSGRTGIPGRIPRVQIPRESPRHHTQPAAGPMKSIPHIHRRTIDIETRKGSPGGVNLLCSFAKPRNERTTRQSPGSVQVASRKLPIRLGRTIRNQFRMPASTPGPDTADQIQAAPDGQAPSEVRCAFTCGNTRGQNDLAL